MSDQNNFFTPTQVAREQAERIESPRGRLLMASCRAGDYMMQRAVAAYQSQLAEADDEGHLLSVANLDYQFSDTETNVRLERDVSGYDVFLFQALYDPISNRPVDQNYMAFLIAARALREWGANCVTAILPYLAYARQDKPTKFQREPTTAKLMADLSIEAGIDRLVVWHPHYPQTQGFYGKIPVYVLEALHFFVKEFEFLRGRDDVIAVAPDVGASKFVTHFSRALDLKSAIASKHRPRPEATEISQVIGDFEGKKIAIVLDDMISSGGTVYTVIKRLAQEEQLDQIYLAASHNLCTPEAQERLRELHADYHLTSVTVTNSIPQTPDFRTLPFVTVKDLAGTLSRVINHIHYNRAVSDLF